MDIWDLKHAKVCDILSADKTFLCILPGETLSFSATEKLPVLEESDHGIYYTQMLIQLHVKHSPSSKNTVLDFNT